MTCFANDWPVANERREKASRRMTAAYHRSYENKHLYFGTGDASRRIGCCEGKRRIVLAEAHDSRDWFQP